MENLLTKMLGISKGLDKDSLARFLRTTPEALNAFEKAYTKAALEQTPESVFEINSRHAAAAMQNKTVDNNCEEAVAIDVLMERIVSELLAQTQVYVFDGTQGASKTFMSLPAGVDRVTNEDICVLPPELRPQLSGDLMKVDIVESAYPHLLWFYERSKNARTEKQRMEAYHRFRQGLDILDLDPVTYEIIGTNPNSMGHWLPKLVFACSEQDFFKIPPTTVAKVPMTLLQLTRQEYGEMTPITLGIVDRWAYEAFGLKDEKEYFIKTGTYSSKFDFRNCHVHGAKEVRELGEYLLFIHYQALQMASPLCSPCIYGVSTTNEWVVREFIPDKENNPCIYKGLPLHTEYRVFVDCDWEEVIGITPYWEPDTMKKRFGQSKDSDSPHQLHDYVIYSAHEETLMRRYHENKDAVVEHIKKILPRLNLRGQWSIDIMQNGDDFWIIDMALAENSAFYNCVPVSKRRPSEENWIPSLPSPTSETN